MVYQWRNFLNKYVKGNVTHYPIMMTEAYSKIEIIMKYYGDGHGRDGANVPFNFRFITDLSNSSSARDVKGVIDLWLDNMPSSRIANWVVRTLTLGIGGKL